MLVSLHPMSASSIWNVSEAAFPANDSPRQKLMFAFKYATLAPTESGWQPWHFRMADNYLDLMAKNSPAREEADPDRREFMIGCGSALQYLKLALKHFGCLGRVVVFPDLGQPALVARVHFGCCRERDVQEKILFDAMTGSRTNRLTPGGTPVSRNHALGVEPHGGGRARLAGFCPERNEPAAGVEDHAGGQSVADEL